MNRRTFLGAISVIGTSLAGCTGHVTVPGESADGSPSGTPTPSATAYSEVERPPCPEFPDSLTDETVAQFITRFEEAYAARVALPTNTANIEAVHVSANTEDVIQTDGGWLVHLTVREPTYTYRSPTESPHYDPGIYYASYFLRDDAVLRARGTEHIDPRENGADSPGEPVSCPPWSNTPT